MHPTTKDDRTWALLAHLSALAGYVIPFGNIVGPLIVWLIKKDQSWFVNDQGKEALNFQLSVTIYLIISAILVFVVVGIVLVIAVAIGALILVIIAAVRANEGITYRYPLTMRFIK